MARPARTRVSNLEVTPSPTNIYNGLLLPQLTQVQINAIPVNSLEPGTLVYNTDLNITQCYQALNGNPAVWTNLTVTPTDAATGVGLVTGNAFILPSGTAAAVEVINNEVEGFTYYDTTSNTIRIRTNAAWLTITAA